MYRACLARQINEVEGLKAMFCGQDELTLWNPTEYDSLKNTLEGKGGSTHGGEEFPQIAFQLQLPLSPPSPFPSSFLFTASLVTRVTLPAFYPSSDTAQVHLSFDPLTAAQEKVLREAALSFVTSKLGQECMLDLVQFAKDWIYDNAMPSASSSSVITPTPTAAASTPKIAASNSGKAPSQSGKAAKKAPAPIAKTAAKPSEAKAKPKPTLLEPKEQDFRRIMIWFSTIAPDRSKTVGEWAKQLGLTGISRLGSPALIAVEGQKDDVDEYVSSLRSYRWKKMEIVWEEKSRSTNLNSCRRFPNFQECMLPMSELQAIFKKANLEDMYKEGLKIRG